MSMTKKTIDNLKPGQRFIYTEGRALKLLLEITKKPQQSPYNYSLVLPVKILSVIKDSYDEYSVGSDEFYVDTGTWKYLEGQDAPKKTRKKQ